MSMFNKVTHILRFLFPEWQAVDSLNTYGFVDVSGLRQEHLGPERTRNNLALAYGGCVMWWVTLAWPLFGLLVFTIAMQSFMRGYCTLWPYNGICAFLCLCTLPALGISALRRLFSVFPWLFAFLAVCLGNALIAVGAAGLLNYGLMVQDIERFALFGWLSLGFLLLARLLFCVLMHHFPQQDAAGIPKTRRVGSQGTPLSQAWRERDLQPFKVCAWICLGWILLWGISLFGVRRDTSPQALELWRHTSVWGLRLGAVIADNDTPFNGQDVAVNADFISTTGHLDVWIWDCCQEDGDYVQLSLDGAALPPFMLTNVPQHFRLTSSAPAISPHQLTVLGIRDAGQGINYAIRFAPGNSITYFNCAGKPAKELQGSPQAQADGFVKGKNIYTFTQKKEVPPR